ncbi:uncharacterized protein LOC131667043 isoform X2 [Phymastichus coffea]|nr:uncharacterized protein LOC131667043 isoform X2 [Phymastichus coffea]XP_058796199.1 uncharacterized protein LOC131667043 isoform X2 [Phymastichus coffea]XP_058796200.1 uncharacterized protein LOC131667043 isoform X2 [Phymastichus coffea]
MRRRTNPVQQWVDSLPSPAKSSTSSIGSIVRQQSVSVDSESASIPECSVEHIYSEKENYIKHSNMTVSTPISVPNSPAIVCPGITRLARDPSFQSDSSHCSSVESLLELRRADPEAVLLNLGFGGGASSPQDVGPLARIPKRFIQPSRLKGIAIDDFVKHQQEANESLDSTSLGYRGLTVIIKGNRTHLRTLMLCYAKMMSNSEQAKTVTSQLYQKYLDWQRSERADREANPTESSTLGTQLRSPYVAPSEIVQKIMQRLREHESHELDVYVNGSSVPEPGKLSVLSPDNRLYLERPRSKSPDMRNKRMIIGQKSFAFGHDGDLIEIKTQSKQSSQESDEVFELDKETQTTSNLGPPIITHENASSSSCSSSSITTESASSPILNKDSTETVISVRRNESLDRNHNHNGEPRRASEGSSQEKSSLSLEQDESRRYSDSVVDDIKKKEATNLRKKNLKRQTKLNNDEDKQDVCAHCGKTCDTEEDMSCCYKSVKQNCWREMEKVLQRNKKLEDVVNRSRVEVAELRNILSSVLSVRMEPGF